MSWENVKRGDMEETFLIKCNVAKADFSWAKIRDEIFLKKLTHQLHVC